jgi:hypothetical protein
MILDKTSLYKITIAESSSIQFSEHMATHYIPLEIIVYDTISYSDTISLIINNKKFDIIKGEMFNLFGFNDKIASIQFWRKHLYIYLINNHNHYTTRIEFIKLNQPYGS